MNKNDDKKTILKLLNKYAESYKVLQQENTDLKSEIIDLKANLKINKEIIEDFFKKNNLTLSPSETESFYIKKLNEENKILAVQLDKTLQEKDEIRNKLTYIEQTVFESINKEKEETEKMRNNIFIMDNALIKKDNIIFALKKKIAKLTENDKTDYEKETFVIDPSSSVNAIHDELLLYKQIYETLTKHIKDLKRSIDNYEKLVISLQVENSKLKFDLKAASQQNHLSNNLHNYHSHNPSNNNNNNNNKYSQRLYYSSNNKEDQLNVTVVRDKAQKIVSVTEISSNSNSVRRIVHKNNINFNNIKKDTNQNNVNYEIQKNRNLTDFEKRKEDLYGEKNCNCENNCSYYNNNNGNRSPNNNNRYSEENDTYIEFEREKRNILEGKVNNETEDWTDLLKQSNMNREEFNYYSKNRGLAKIIDLIENLNKLLRDKNFQIRILLEENKNLNFKNEELIKENSALNKQVLLLLKESIKNPVKTNGNRNTKGDTLLDSSMINNTSRNTGINNLTNNNGKIFSILNSNNKSKQLSKNYQSENIRKNVPEIIPTLESVTSSEFRNGINVNESGFMSNANDENDVIEMKNIDINQN